MKTVLFILIFITIIGGVQHTATYLKSEVRAWYQSALHQRGLESLVEHWYKERGWVVTEKPDVCELASARSVEATTDWSHDGFYETALTALPNYSYLGENLSQEGTPESIFTQWLASPSHRKNLETEFDYHCLRCTDKVCAHIFAKDFTYP